MIKITVILEFNDPMPEVGKLYGITNLESTKKEVVKILRILKLEWREIEDKRYLFVTVSALKQKQK